jgi:hypothetical protein
MGADSYTDNYDPAGKEMQAFKRDFTNIYPQHANPHDLMICDRRWVAVADTVPVYRAGYSQIWSKTHYYNTHYWSFYAFVYPTPAAAQADAATIATATGPQMHAYPASAPPCPPDDGKEHDLPAVTFGPHAHDSHHTDRRHLQPADTIDQWAHTQFTYTQTWAPGSFAGPTDRRTWRRVNVEDIAVRGRVLIWTAYASTTADQPTQTLTQQAATTAITLQLQRLNGTPPPSPLVTATPNTQFKG